MFPIPTWLEKVPESDKPLAMQRFLLRIAALYASRDGDLGYLAELTGKSKSALLNYTGPRGTIIPVMTAKKIEELVGREIVTREMLRPDIFKIDVT